VFYLGRLLALLASKYWPEKTCHGQELAYLTTAYVTKKKIFINLTPGVNVIKLVSFITDDEAQ